MYGNPYTPLMERDKRSAGTRGLMDSRTPKCALSEVMYAVGPGSYDPKPIESSACSSQPAFGSSAKRFDRKSYCLFTGNEDEEAHKTFSFQNPVGVGCYDITRKEKYPLKMRYQSPYRCDAQRYLSNLQRDPYLLQV